MLNEFTYKDNNGNMHFMSNYIRFFLENNVFDENYINALNNCIKNNISNKKLCITENIELFKLIYNEYKLIKHNSAYNEIYYTFK